MYKIETHETKNLGWLHNHIDRWSAKIAVKNRYFTKNNIVLHFVDGCYLSSIKIIKIGNKIIIHAKFKLNFIPFLGIVWWQGSWTWTRLRARFFCKRLKSIFSLFLYPSLKFTNLEKEKEAIKSTDYVTPLNPMDRT